MKEHHLAWLSTHVDRSPLWLSKHLAEGFDIHHMDGDHYNNDPANLILIEACDHMRLHGIPATTVKRLTGTGPKGPHKRTYDLRMEEGKRCYDARVAGANWREIGTIVYGYRTQTRVTLSRAKWYAAQAGLVWPPSRVMMTA